MSEECFANLHLGAAALDRIGYLVTLGRLTILGSPARCPKQRPAAPFGSKASGYERLSRGSISTIPPATCGEHLDLRQHVSATQIAAVRSRPFAVTRCRQRCTVWGRRPASGMRSPGPGHYRCPVSTRSQWNPAFLSPSSILFRACCVPNCEANRSASRNGAMRIAIARSRSASCGLSNCA